MKDAKKVILSIAPSAEDLAEYVAADRPGHRKLIFCDPKITLEMEKAIAGRPSEMFTAEVTSVARYVKKNGGPKVLSGRAAAMVIGTIAARNKSRLSCFGRNPAGSAGKLYETIGLLRSSMATPEMLETAAEASDGLRKEKLRDIRLVYGEYLDFLKTGSTDAKGRKQPLTDESGLWRALADALGGQKKDFGETHIVLAGFSSFPLQFGEAVRIMLREAESVEVVCIGGAEKIYTNEAEADFRRAAEKFGFAWSRGMAGLSPSVCPEAEFIRQNLYSHLSGAEKEEKEKEARAAAAAVELYSARDEEDEVTHIAERIKREVLDNGLRYRDIAVLLPGPGAYTVEVNRIFGEYRIPFYADTKKKLSEHPLAGFVLGWFDVVSGNFSPEDVDAFIGNMFFDKNRDGRDMYRLLLVRYANYRGGVNSLRVTDHAAEYPLDIISNMNGKFMRAFRRDEKKGLRRRKGREYCAIIRSLLREFSCRERQEEEAARLRACGDISAAKFFERGYDGIEGVLADIDLYSGGEEYAAEEFSAVLLQGFETQEVSLIPVYLDSVYVGEIGEWRGRRAKVVFAARMTESALEEGADTALISDSDIDDLEKKQVTLRPKLSEMNARKREAAALALTSFSERLYVSCPASEHGKDCRPGASVQYLKDLFEKEGWDFFRTLSAPDAERIRSADLSQYIRETAAFRCSEKTPALRFYAAETRRCGEKESAGLREGIRLAMAAGGDDPVPVFCGLGPRDQESSFIPNAEELLLGGDTVSATLVETYCGCPYKCFLSRGLGLAEKKEGCLDAMEAGSFMHTVLQRTADALSPGRPTEPAAFAAKGKETAEAVLKEPPYCYLSGRGRDRNTRQVMIRDAGRICYAVSQNLQKGDFTVEKNEQTFGYPDSPYAGEPITYQTEGPNGRKEKKLKLVGKIDRVDTCGNYVRVIDYKTGATQFKTEKYYTGQSIQLPLYLHMASCVRGKDGGAPERKVPAGAYYFPAAVRFPQGDAPYRMSGFTGGRSGKEEILRASDPYLPETGESAVIDAERNSKGWKNTVPPEDMRDYVRYSVLLTKKCVQQIAGGYIGVSPYEGSCVYCSYGGICGYDAAARGERKEKKVADADILAGIRAEGE